MAGFDEGKFSELKSKKKAFYDALSPVFCPALKDKVHFTSDGFHQLSYDGSRSERAKNVQYSKLKCLPRAVEVLRIATTYQEYRKSMIPVGKPGSDGFRKTSLLQYWGFVVASQEANVRINVVVRRVGNGQLHFWSVMPFWDEMKLVDGQMIKVLGKMDLANI